MFSPSSTSTACRKIAICSMAEHSPQEFPSLLFLGPIRVQLPHPALDHGPCGSMRGIDEGDSFRGRFGREKRRLNPTDDLDAQLSHGSPPGSIIPERPTAVH